MLEQIVFNAPIFLLVLFRCFTTMMTLPLLSSKTVPRMAKIALALYMAYFIFPTVSQSGSPYGDYRSYVSPEGNFNLEYIFLLVGEGMIGIILGFYIQIIFAAFSTAGQFFAFQMGLSASEVYDSLSQVENPLMGQFFNFLAMIVFLQHHWFQTMFCEGLAASFKAMNAFSIVNNTDFFARFMMTSLSMLFKDALIIALPIMGSLFLINVTMGIFTKAAPQMNLLSEGFPILMLVSFFLIAVLVPHFCQFFEESIYGGFKEIQSMLTKLSGGITR
ncbi:flagellar biosynthetic protein FliR [Treponema sp.]|uniref:flagellar biosynthetic protein FliR n=1 Tax=Treponema sp. TaxID=166 RepID=UPI00388EF91C